MVMMIAWDKVPPATVMTAMMKCSVAAAEMRRAVVATTVMATVMLGIRGSSNDSDERQADDCRRAANGFDSNDRFLQAGERGDAAAAAATVMFRTNA